LQFIKQHPVLLTFIALIAVVIGLFARTYLENKNQDSQGGWGGDITVVVTAPVRMATIVDEVESIGTAKANESVSLTSKVTDTVSKVNFEDGMIVQAGHILVELTNSEETAQLAEAQAAVDESTRQFNRVQNLITQNLASATQLDIEKARMQTANARLEAIVARLDDRLIRAPFSGVLGFRGVSQGTLLSPNKIVTTLDDISIIKLDFSIPENYLAVLSEGQEVIATSPAYPDRTFLGTVEVINSRVDPITRSITIRAHLNNDERLLRPGMLLTVNLVRNRSLALVVPEEAILPIQDKQYVYVVQENTAQRVEVKAGRRRPGIVEILIGLEEGQLVVTQGVIKIRPGSKVTIKGENQTAGVPGDWKRKD
jgi:membrane fusion protein (multidrug efflux system)